MSSDGCGVGSKEVRSVFLLFPFLVVIRSVDSSFSKDLRDVIFVCEFV